MNYHRDKNKKWINTGIIIASIVLVIVLITLTPISTGLAKFFHGIGTPLWKGKEATHEGVSNMFRTKKSLLKENEELKAQLADQEVKFLAAKNLEKENETLRGLLGRSDGAQPILLASILSRPPQSLYDTMTIDIGKKSGVVEGKMVLANGTIILGEVAEVYADTSLVRLYSAPGVITEIFMETSDIHTTMRGRGVGNFVIEFPRDVEITQGESITHIASGKQVGIVRAVDFDPRDPFQMVFVESPVNLQSLRFVEVVR